MGRGNDWLEEIAKKRGEKTGRISAPKAPVKAKPKRKVVAGPPAKKPKAKDESRGETLDKPRCPNSSRPATASKPSKSAPVNSAGGEATHIVFDRMGMRVLPGSVIVNRSMQLALVKPFTRNEFGEFAIVAEPYYALGTLISLDPNCFEDRDFEWRVYARGGVTMPLPWSQVRKKKHEKDAVDEMIESVDDV